MYTNDKQIIKTMTIRRHFKRLFYQQSENWSKIDKTMSFIFGCHGNGDLSVQFIMIPNCCQ